MNVSKFQIFGISLKEINRHQRPIHTLLFNVPEANPKVGGEEATNLKKTTFQ